MKTKRYKHPLAVHIGIIIIAACLLILPQLWSKGMIIGSDSIFHFNRFYDAAMQIKNGNFQYFISMYGFQQTGRIVNAFYGPLVAYFQGLLVLISPSWFVYQMLSNFLLYVLAGCSMYSLLRKARVRGRIGLYAALIFMTTYAIQYWTIRQGFTSWGAALLPLCLIPVIDMVRHKKINSLTLGIFTALMVQTHLLSSLFLICIYLPCFLYAFFTSERKLALVKSLSLAILLFFCLTMNIWISFAELYLNNQILSPFINKTMQSNTINGKSSYWVVNPVLLAPLVLFQLFHACKHWKYYEAMVKICLLIGTVFFFLSTNFVPWNWLIAHDFILAELIQFPFRFFVPVTVLLLFGAAITVDTYYKELPVMAKAGTNLVVALCLAQTMVLTSTSLIQWNKEGAYIKTGKHTFVQSEDADEVGSAFFAKDMSLALKTVEKSTPDYLPVYDEDHGNSYNEYEKQIIDTNNSFNKRVVNHSLVIEWTAEDESDISIPVIVYKNTRLTINGQQLSSEDTQLSALGSSTITQKKGGNRVVLTYHESVLFPISLLLTLGSWGACLLWGTTKRLFLLATQKESKNKKSYSKPAVQAMKKI